jgi:glycosyltransferase involved in cell wall biosynthesis
MNNRYPKVAVLMPVYNGEKYLHESIESILNQSLQDFEFLIINDKSSDESVNIIKSYNDLRIRLVNNEANLGVGASLNKGLDLARGKYIARMDCDDISYPDRLLKQVEFMDENPDVGICGTDYQALGMRSGRCRCPTNRDEIKCWLLFNSPLAHPSVMLRKDFIKKTGLKYNPDYSYAEDYEFWWRASQHFPLANIGEILIYYRFHPYQLTQKHKIKNENTAARVRKDQLNALGIKPNEEEFDIHLMVSNSEYETTKTFIQSVVRWFEKLIAANKGKKIYPEPAFSALISEKAFNIFYHARSLGPWIFQYFWESFLRDNRTISYWKKLQFSFLSFFWPILKFIKHITIKILSKFKISQT